MKKLNEKQKARFQQHIQKSSNSECWLWIGSLRRGYGYLEIQRKKYSAHRLSYELFIGEIPEGLLVCHTCDIKNCVNPKHLFAGTQSDNVQDAIRKGRLTFEYLTGENSTNTKLTNKQIGDLLNKIKAGSKQKDVAKEYGISEASISQIVHGKRRMQIND